MPTHVILGATGGVGSAVLHSLLESNTPDLTVNVLIRSKEKLVSLVPNVEKPSSNIKVNIFTGSITDHEVLTDCLKDSTVIYQCVSGSAPSKKTTIAQDAANSVVSALKTIQLKTGKNYERPTVLLNRSSTLNPSIKIPVSATFFSFLKWSLQDIYADLTVAAETYRTAESRNLLHAIFVDAPNLFHPFERVKTGHEIFAEGDISLGVNYADFGEAEVEIAERREEFRGKAVGVRATGEVKPAWGPNLYALASGTWARLSPW